MRIYTPEITNKTDDIAACLITPQDSFLESMAEATSTIVDYEKNNIAFITEWKKNAESILLRRQPDYGLVPGSMN